MNLKYKQLLLSCLLCSLTGLLSAQSVIPQSSYTLTANETGTIKKYVAQNYISLKPGFSYNASGGSSFNAKIDADLIVPPTNGNYLMPDGSISAIPFKSNPVMFGSVVGSIAGNASVSLSGVGTYQVPIEVPQGIAGMQPQVSIVYSSQGGFGALGNGWDISGISSISLTSQNLYYDGSSGKVESNSVLFNSKDRLSLDGQRLIKLSGTDLAAEAVYGTEVENYALIKIVANPSGGIYFQVTTKDGKTMEYGKTTDSRIVNSSNPTDGRVLGYNLNKVTDVYGNYVEYLYSDNGQYLAKINYTGTSTDNPRKSIDFTYSTNTFNPKTNYISDFKILKNKILTYITTSSNQAEQRKYSFAYNSENKLKSISESALNGEKVNSTVINWGSELGGIQTEIKEIDMLSATDTRLNNINFNEGGIYTGDINGDGYADRIEFWAGSASEMGHLWVYLFDKNTNTFSTNPYKESLVNQDYKVYQPKLTVTDVDNDGKDEIILVDAGIVKQYGLELDHSELNVDLGTGIQTSTDVYALKLNQNTFNTIGVYRENKRFEIFSTDINHDKYNDVVIFYNRCDYGYEDDFPEYMVCYGSATGLTYHLMSDRHVIPDLSFHDFRIGDFNADGKVDILGLADYENNVHVDNEINFVSSYNWGNHFVHPAIKEKITLDINGDGLTDALQTVPASNYAYNPVNSVRYLINTGGFSSLVYIDNDTEIEPPYPHDTWSKKEINSVYTIDYNGDGLSDLILGYNDGNANQGDWYFYKNVNGRFVYEKNIHWNQPIPKVNCGLVMDINGDGCQDLVLPKGAGFVAFTMPNASKLNLVTSITNGMGLSQGFTYTNYSDYNQNPTTGVVGNVKAPLMLVKSFSDVDGSVTDYEFKDGKIHKEGKGFLGFTTVIAKNSIKGTTSTSNYEVEPTYYGLNLVKQVASTYAGNKPISTLVQTNEVKIIDAEKKRFIPVVSSQISTDNLRNITTTSQNLAYDANWNVTESKTTLGNLTTTTSTTYKSRNGGVLYLPGTVTTTKQNGSDSFTKTVKYDYNTNGALIKETRDVGDENELTTDYTEFDQYGHATKISVTANGKILNSALKYTASGYYLEKETNNLDEITTYTWDEYSGVIQNKKDNWNNLTTYNYNNWGQVKETIYADGNWSVNALQWLSSDNSLGAKYYSYVQTGVSGPRKIYYNALGQEIVSETVGLNGISKFSFTEYFPDGRVKRVSEPTFNPEVKVWAATNTYDEYGRVKTITNQRLDVSTYDYNNKTITLTTPEGTTETTVNDAGQTITNKVNFKTVTYDYYASGLVKSSTPDGGTALSMIYDLQGNRIKLTDPDAGVIDAKYDGFGKLLWEKQLIHSSDAANAVITTNNYDDKTGLLLNISRVGKITSTTTYIYDADLGHKSRIKSIGIGNQHFQKYNYDALGRVTSINQTIDGRNYTTSTEYDILGRVKKQIFPSGYYTQNNYDKYGNIFEVTVNANRSIWKAVTENQRGQLTEVSRGGKTTSFGYDDLGMPTSIFSENIVDLTYQFYPTGNLEFRTDNSIPGLIQKEVFQYDGSNRLKNWDVYRNNSLSKENYIVYNNGSGNIEKKSDLGDYILSYGVKNTTSTLNKYPGPHALTGISEKPLNFPAADLSVTYTDFKKISKLDEGDKHYEITYGVDNERVKSVQTQGSATVTRYYLGSYEEEIEGNNTKKIHYLCDGAILVVNNGVETFYYGYSDYQGSLVALANESGTVVDNGRFAYDPWGARRDPADWTQKDSRTSWLTNRGYTGHEHLDAFGIINMNGRVYDPATAMFFSPDPYVQAPDDWLNYNRYSYVLNNPMKYTDPSGNLFYVIPSVSYSYYGGTTVSVSFGFGAPGLFSAGATVSYGLKNGNFAITGNFSAAGFYAYGGWDSKSGVIAGAGIGFGTGSSSPFGITSSITSLSLNFSESDGLSASGFGFNYNSRGGMSFDPSIGASETLTFGHEYVYDDAPSNDIVSLAESSLKSSQIASDYLKSVNQGEGINGVDKIFYGVKYEDKQIYTDGDGIIHRKSDNGKVSGVSDFHHNGFSVTADIHLSPRKSIEGFKVTYNHELIHIYHYNKFAGGKNLIEYSESVAHTNNQQVFPYESAPSFDYSGSNYSPTDIPNYLIRTTPASLPLRSPDRYSFDINKIRH